MGFPGSPRRRQESSARKAIARGEGGNGPRRLECLVVNWNGVVYKQNNHKPREQAAEPANRRAAEPPALATNNRRRAAERAAEPPSRLLCTRRAL